MTSHPVVDPARAGGDQIVPVADSEELDDADHVPGVTRIDVVCQPQAVGTVLAATRRWADDRALPVVACERLTGLVYAAIGYGLRFDPRGVTLLIRWIDPDRIRLDLRWHGCSATARESTADCDVSETISTLDAIAETWGFGRGRRGPVHWMVVDTR